MRSLLAALLLAGCSPSPSRLAADDSGGARPVAEYEPATGVLFATGLHRTFSELTGLDPVRVASNLRRAQEYEAMDLAIMRSQPGLRYFLHADHSHTDGVAQTEADLWAPVVAAWQAQHLDVAALTLDAADYPAGTSDDRLNEDEWSRDYGPVALSSPSGVSWLSIGQRGALVDAALAQRLGRSASNFAGSWLEGGNLMSTTTGVCATAGEISPELRARLGCRSVIAVPRLPNEGTGHIDLFAKFLADDRVLVSRYGSDDVVAKPTLVTVTYSCTAEQIAAKSWYDCAGKSGPTTSAMPQAATTWHTAQDMRDFIAAAFPATEPFARQEFGALVAHGDAVAKTFADAGFQVTRIPAPTPEVSFGLEVYQDASGHTVRQVLELNYLFRSFANSLVLNGWAYVPQYDETPELDAAALGLYADLGWKTVAVPMTETIKAGGAVHCLTKDLH